jgi:hypothetical protein
MDVYVATFLSECGCQADGSELYGGGRRVRDWKGKALDGPAGLFAPDGKRFLILLGPNPESLSSPSTVLLNFTDELRRRVQGSQPHPHLRAARAGRAGLK